ncbi:MULTISPECIES: hypothetical protein [Tsukamurella]|uniref:Uncharacterized protein n=2 Tax=Tsukamurella TaxID=2060 RepID=A0A5C5S6J0_9ACTN|nr:MULTISPECIES: hypothetical protein [Tsukamurella]NMD55185.1 hypothetical protein [Tsukamurella columbiensis]TWS30208.1 hypothetical protein FK530_06775 [Tsukamurella conjunctivitidis]
MKRPDSSLVRELNEGRPGWSQTDHLLADLWAITVRANSTADSTPDHPVRALMEARARAAEKAARTSELVDRFRRLKNRYKTRRETS